MERSWTLKRHNARSTVSACRRTEGRRCAFQWLCIVECMDRIPHSTPATSSSPPGMQAGVFLVARSWAETLILYSTLRHCDIVIGLESRFLEFSERIHGMVRWHGTLRPPQQHAFQLSRCCGAKQSCKSFLHSAPPILGTWRVDARALRTLADGVGTLPYYTVL